MTWIATSLLIVLFIVVPAGSLAFYFWHLEKLEQMREKSFENGYQAGKIAESIIAGTSRPPVTVVSIPQELIDIVDKAAGKEHSRQGAVVRCLVDVLNAYNAGEDL